MEFGEKPNDQSAELEIRKENLRSYLEEKINNGKEINVLNGRAFFKDFTEEKLGKWETVTLYYVNDNKEAFEIEFNPGELFLREKEGYNNEHGEKTYLELQKRFEELGIKLTPEGMVNEDLRKLFEKDQ